MKNILRLIRVKHYVKNFLIFLPLVFSLNLENVELVVLSCMGFAAFCLVSSIVYIINDIKDIEKDRNHSAKCMRPLAKGAITIKKAIIIIGIFSCLTGVIVFFIASIWATIFLIVYLAINIFYSFGVKNVPVVEVILLATGFVLRLLFGGAVIGVEISPWLLFTVLSGSIYLGLGKRRNEIIGQNEATRDVNNAYSKEFLDKNMYLFAGTAIVFFALWCIRMDEAGLYANRGIIYTVPLIIILFLRYSFLVELDRSGELKSDGDPTSLILSDKFLMIILLIMLVYIIIIIYIPLNIILE